MGALRFKDRFLTPPVARAIMSPLGIVLAGLGAAVGIVAGAPLAAAAGLGVAAWAGQVLMAVPRGPRAAYMAGGRLDQPWRGYVEGVQQARERYDRILGDMSSGPLRDRLRAFAVRLDDGVTESWRIARRGNEIARALDRLDTVSPRQELARLTSSLAGASPTPATAETIRSLEAQIAAAERLRATADGTRDRLRLLDARFDELVARAVEVSVGAADSDLLGNDVDDLVDELESLRTALDETSEVEAGAIGVPMTLPPPPEPEPRGA